MGELGSEAEFIVRGFPAARAGGLIRDAIPGYRGLHRWGLETLRAVELDGLGQPPDELTAEWEAPFAMDLSPEILPSTRQALSGAREYLAGVAWSRMPEYAPREWELVGMARVESQDDVAAATERIRRAAMERYAWMCSGPRLYGVEVLEWPSTWSVMERSVDWCQQRLPLNEFGLARDYQEAVEIWARYLRVDDERFGAADMYRTVAVIGCGVLWSPASRGAPDDFAAERGSSPA